MAVGVAVIALVVALAVAPSCRRNVEADIYENDTVGSSGMTKSPTGKGSLNWDYKMEDTMNTDNGSTVETPPRLPSAMSPQGAAVSRILNFPDVQEIDVDIMEITMSDQKITNSTEL